MGENRLDACNVEASIKAGVRYICEGCAMSCTEASLDVLKIHNMEGDYRIVYAPSQLATLLNKLFSASLIRLICYR